MNTSCKAKDERSELEKQTEFESHFEPGMSRDEVEQRLNEIEITEFIEERKVNNGNGDFEVTYRASYEDWGAETYVFRFTTEGELIVVYPLLN